MAEELYKMQPLTEETRRRMDAAYPVFAGDGGQAPFGPSRYMLPVDAEPFLRQYASTPVDPGDVWIVTLPKCGESRQPPPPRDPDSAISGPRSSTHGVIRSVSFAVRSSRFTVM